MLYGTIQGHSWEFITIMHLSNSCHELKCANYVIHGAVKGCPSEVNSLHLKLSVRKAYSLIPGQKMHVLKWLFYVILTSVLCPPNAFFSSSLFWSILRWLTLGLSSYIVGETWKCYTKKRCELTSLVFYFFFQVSWTITHLSLWPTLKFKVAFIRYGSSSCIMHSLVVTVLVKFVLIPVFITRKALYGLLTCLCSVQVIKAQHSHQGRGGATIQVIHFICFIVYFLQQLAPHTSLSQFQVVNIYSVLFWTLWLLQVELRDVDTGNKITERFRTDEALESMICFSFSYIKHNTNS
jgi:hypothetical protein